MNKKTLVLGASTNTDRYSNKAIKKLTANKHSVVAIGNKDGMVDATPILTDKPKIDGVDTVTLYLNAANQQPYYDYILSLQPKRIIFNPGAENEDLATLAEAKGINTMEACTLVLLATNQY